MSLQLKKEQPEKIERNDLQFDLTGQYMKIGKGGFYIPDETILERALAAFHIHIFVENAWFLLENADKVFSDSRMFFAGVETGSHLAYFGKSGFKNACLGVYLEWWLHFSEESVDKAGNLIWYMAGSPLTGANNCCSVTSEGKRVKMAGDTGFRGAWQSFIDVNSLYSEAKQRCEAFTLEEVLLKLKGEDYQKYLDELKQECIDRTVIYNNSPGWPNDSHLKKIVKSNRKTQMQIKWREIMDFYETFAEKEEEMNIVKDQEDTVRYRELLHKLADFSSQFISETFGKNVNRICLTDVINFAKYRQSL